MPLIVNYPKDKNWNASTNKFADPEMKTEADQIGHLLMTIGMSELTEKTLHEVIIRKLILDRLYDATYYKANEKEPTINEYKEIFGRHIGLFIEGRWAHTETRWKFTARHAKGMMQDITYKVSN